MDVHSTLLPVERLPPAVSAIDPIDNERVCLAGVCRWHAYVCVRLLRSGICRLLTYFRSHVILPGNGWPFYGKSEEMEVQCGGRPAVPEDTN